MSENSHAQSIELSPEVLEALKDVSELLAEGEPADATLHRIVDVTCRTLDGCDAAGISILKDGKFQSPVATDEWALAVDQAQYDNNEGPCLDAGLEAETIEIASVSSEERWPRFATKAEELGLKSSLSLPLGPAVGALNVYSRRENAFTEADRVIGALLVTQAAITIRNAQLYTAARDLAEGLQTALESRDVIGQAKGILMEREGVDDVAAFEMLKTLSQHANLKLRDVAEHLVQENHKSSNGPQK